MPSPFPGMNPYLEQPDAWHDFHQSVIVFMRGLLTPQIRPKYFAQVESDLYIHEMPEDERRHFARADVSVSRGEQASEAITSTATITAPARARLPVVVDELHQNYIEIRDRESRNLVTVIELLSPTNKYAGADRQQYLVKRRELLKSDVNFVEIDLLRGEPRMPLDDSPEADYLILVSRAGERPDVDLWPIALSEQLPTISIPLRGDDGDAQLELQEVLHRAYDAAGYDDYIYNNAPQPRLSAEQQSWAEELLDSAK